MTIETARPHVIYADLGAPAAVIVRGRNDALVIADHHVTAPHLAAAVTTAAVLQVEDFDVATASPISSLPLPRGPEGPDGG